MTDNKPEILEICQKWIAAEGDDARQAIRDRVMKYLAAQPEDSPPTLAESLDPLIAKASAAKTEAEAAACFDEWTPPPEADIQPLQAFIEEPKPETILWRDTEDDSQNRWQYDPILAVGEVAVLAAPGGTGKSYLSLAVAVAAAAAAWPNGHGKACGLCAKAGPVVVVSYEDSAVRMAYRVKNMGPDEFPDQLYTWESPDPLWQGDPSRPGKTMPAASWRSLWDKVKAVKARLVIIDPASAALVDVSANEASPVRHFFRSIEKEAEAVGCGVLIVAHDTKSGRNEARDTGTAGAGAIAGSAVWFDAARGVLYLHRTESETTQRHLTAIKANHGRTGWGAVLRDVMSGTTYRGLELVEAHLPDAWREITKTEAKAKTNGKGTTKKKITRLPNETDAEYSKRVTRNG